MARAVILSADENWEGNLTGLNNVIYLSTEYHPSREPLAASTPFKNYQRAPLMDDTVI